MPFDGASSGGRRYGVGQRRLSPSGLTGIKLDAFIKSEVDSLLTNSVIMRAGLYYGHVNWSQ